MSKQILHNCPECEMDYEPRRSDQKYCTRKCRNDYNNRRYKSARQHTQRINLILENNHRILKSIQASRLTRNELTSLGFNLKFYTHQSRTTNDDIIFCLYDDIGYCYGSGNLVYIIPLKN